MAIDIKDVLNIFYENKCHFAFNAYDKKEFLILNLQDWNCQLYLTSPHSNGINFSLRYYCDANGQNTTYHPTYYTEDIETVFPILDKIIAAQQNANYLATYPNDTEGLSKHNSVVGAFKKILAEENFPPEFDCIISKDDNEVNITLTEKNSDRIYFLNLSQLDYISQNKEKIHSITGVLELSFFEQFKSDSDAGHNNYYTMIIPGYELHQYPLLQKQNKINEADSHMHFNFESWIKEVIEFPNLKSKELQSHLQHAILEDEVPQKNSTTKNTKRKL